MSQPSPAGPRHHKGTLINSAKSGLDSKFDVMEAKRALALKKAVSENKIKISILGISRRRDSFLKRHTYFTVQVDCGAEKWEVDRKSSQIVKLYQRCNHKSSKDMAAIVHLQSKFSKWNPVETRRAAFQKTLNTLIKKPVFLDFKPVLRFLEVTGIKQNYNNSKSQNTQAHEWRLRYEDRSPLVYFLKALLRQVVGYQSAYYTSR